MGWAGLTLSCLVHEPLSWCDSWTRNACCWRCATLALRLFPPELVYLGLTSFLTRIVVSVKPSELNSLSPSPVFLRDLILGTPEPTKSHVWATQELALLSNHLAMHFHNIIPRNYLVRRLWVGEEARVETPSLSQYRAPQSAEKENVHLGDGDQLGLCKVRPTDCLPGKRTHWSIIKKF